MNYHNSYTGSVKKKILLRVLVVLVSLIVISALTLAYGNYLKSKARALPEATIPERDGRTAPTSTGRKAR